MAGDDGPVPPGPGCPPGAALGLSGGPRLRPESASEPVAVKDPLLLPPFDAVRRSDFGSAFLILSDGGKGLPSGPSSCSDSSSRKFSHSSASVSPYNCRQRRKGYNEPYRT